MENLKKEWLTEGLIDFEYKRYMLLAYLQNTKASFKRIELYPFLSDLVDHYQRLLTVKESKTIINASFPKELTEEGLKKLKLTYRKVVEDDVVMREIESIIEFALPQFKTSLDEGAFIYDYVESNCELSPVGLTSLYSNEGYLFIAPPPQRETNVYRYQVSIFGNANDPIRTLNTEYVMTTERSLANSYENIKLQLIKQNALLPNPSVYLITSRMNFPYTSTLMPIAKRLLIKHISKPV